MDFEIDLTKAFAFSLDPSGDFFAVFGGERSDGSASSPHHFVFVRHSRSSARLFPAILGSCFHSFLFGLPLLLTLGHSRMRQDAKPRGQSLLLAFFFATLNFDVNVIRVAQLLL